MVLSTLALGVVEAGQQCTSGLYAGGFAGLSRHTTKNKAAGNEENLPDALAKMDVTIKEGDDMALSSSFGFLGGLEAGYRMTFGGNMFGDIGLHAGYDHSKLCLLHKDAWLNKSNFFGGVLLKLGMYLPGGAAIALVGGLNATRYEYRKSSEDGTTETRSGTEDKKEKGENEIHLSPVVGLRIEAPFNQERTGRVFIQATQEIFPLKKKVKALHDMEIRNAKLRVVAGVSWFF